jgi:hypothetical protein
METIDVRNLRSGERWTLTELLTGSFGGTEVVIVNIAEQGVQLAHAQPLRIATRARLWFKRGEVAVNVTGMVVWSHLSKTPNAEGKYLYESGVRAEPEGDELTAALQAFADHGLLRHDAESLERKRRRVEERMNAPKPMMKILRTDGDVPSDQSLLVQHAHERLRANPDEALKWYNRARFAVGDDVPLASDHNRHRDDVLAVWEYLERTVPLSTIVRVFERRV